MEFLQVNKIKGASFPFKSYISKLSFELGRNPVVEKNNNQLKFIPEKHKAVLLISADFELAWAFRFTKTEIEPVKNALLKAKLARKNIPGILQLCEQFKVPVTWATVGHLFLNSCIKERDLVHANIKRLDYFESPYWKYNHGDWFDADPASNLQTSPEWYAPDLIEAILNSNVKHEIGSHTFSHIDCRDSICKPEVFDSELLECIKLAEMKNISLKSFIYPGHTIGNIERLKSLGFTSYRSNYVNTIGAPEMQKDGIWIHKSTSEFDIRPNWSIKYHIYRYKKMIDRALKHGGVCHFWFHPSFSSQFLNEVMPAVFEYIDKRRNELFITTMGKYTDYLNRTIEN